MHHKRGKYRGRYSMQITVSQIPRSMARQWPHTKTHVKKKCAIAMLNLQGIKNIQKYLTVESCTELVVSLCISHLEYSNSILVGLPDCTIKQMQRIQKCGAKLVLGRTKYESNKQALVELHWLPRKSKIKFKILTLVFKCIRWEMPDCVMNLLVGCPETTCTLRSNSIKDRLVIPWTVRKTFASRSFSVMGLVLWNRLPNFIKDGGNVDQFKKTLKTFLFAISNF